MKEEKSSVGIIIMVGVAVLIGAILVQIIADQTIAKTQLLSITDTINVNTAVVGVENKTKQSIVFTVTNPPTTWRQDLCPLTAVTMTNVSGATLTETTGWVMNKALGTFYMVNGSEAWTSFSGATNTTSVTYTYCPDEYINESWQRTVLNLVPGFFVLAILMGVAFVIFYIMRKEGIELN
jgi:hypothetical protein